MLDYLLKPLNNSEFIKALSKAKDVLSNQNQIKKTISDYQNQKLRLDKRELLLKLIESSENYNSLDLYPLTQTGIHPDTGTFQIATILIDRLEELFAPQLEKGALEICNFQYRAGNFGNIFYKHSISGL